MAMKFFSVIRVDYEANTSFSDWMQNKIKLLNWKCYQRHCYSGAGKAIPAVNVDEMDYFQKYIHHAVTSVMSMLGCR